MPTVQNPDAAEHEDLVIKLDDIDIAPRTDDDDVPAPAPDAAAAPAAPAAAEAPVAPSAGLEEINKRLTDEQTARTATEERNRILTAERDRAVAFAQEAERRGISQNELLTESQIMVTNEQMEGIAKEIATLMEGGEYTKTIPLNLKLNKLGGEIALLEGKKNWLAEQREIAKNQPPAPTDPFEKLIDGRGEPLKAFLRRHRELVRSDGSFTREAVAGHTSAVGLQLQIGTPEYYDHIEDFLAGKVKPAAAAAAPAAAAAAPARSNARQTAAPVSRNGGGGRVVPGMDGSTFVMTAKMRRLADEQGVAPGEWAAHYVKAVKEGRMEPIPD